MTRAVVRTRRIEAPAASVWEALSDVANVARFNPTIARSAALPDAPLRGRGARRHCDFHARGLWVEETVTDWNEESRSYAVSVDRGPGKPPLGDIAMTFSVDNAGAGACRVTMAIVVEPQNLAQRAALPASRPMLERLVDMTLAGLDLHARTGHIVDTRRDVEV